LQRHFGADFLEDEADMRCKRVITQHRVPGLDQVNGPDGRQRREQQREE
jgi:hypothetical protein